MAIKNDDIEETSNILDKQNIENLNDSNNISEKQDIENLNDSNNINKKQEIYDNDLNEGFKLVDNKSKKNKNNIKKNLEENIQDNSSKTIKKEDIQDNSLKTIKEDILDNSTKTIEESSKNTSKGTSKDTPTLKKFNGWNIPKDIPKDIPEENLEESKRIINKNLINGFLKLIKNTEYNLIINQLIDFVDKLIESNDNNYDDNNDLVEIIFEQKEIPTFIDNLTKIDIIAICKKLYEIIEDNNKKYISQILKEFNISISKTTILKTENKINSEIKDEYTWTDENGNIWISTDQINWKTKDGKQWELKNKEIEKETYINKLISNPSSSIIPQK